MELVSQVYANVRVFRDKGRIIIVLSDRVYVAKEKNMQIIKKTKHARTIPFLRREKVIE